MLLPSALAAQSATAGARLQSFSFTDASETGVAKADLLTLPWAVSVPVDSWATLLAGGAFGRGVVTMDGGESATLSGPTDSYLGLRADWRSFSLLASASLPTGDGARTDEGVAVPGVLRTDLLPFQRLRWGSGLSLGGDVTYGISAGRTSVTLTGGYAVVQEYGLLASATADYAPGAETRVRLAIESVVGATSVLAVQLGAQRYASDEFDGFDRYTSGVRIDGLASFTFAFGQHESAKVYTGAYGRARSELVEGSVFSPPIELLLPGAGPAPGRNLWVVGAESLLSRLRLQARPHAELRVLRSGSGLGQGWLVTVGSSATYRVLGVTGGRRLDVGPSASGHVGRVVPDADSASPLRGFSAGVTAHWTVGG